VDDLETLGTIARADEGLWFHVDGALGAPALLAHSLCSKLRGLEQADSLALDFHKWLQVPYEAGCVLVRDEAAHRNTFAYEADYLLRLSRGLAARSPRFGDYGVELSRGFKALKIWITFQTYGVQGLARVVETNAAQAPRLATTVDAEPALERLAPVALNVVCFRYRPPGVDATRLDENQPGDPHAATRGRCRGSFFGALARRLCDPGLHHQPPNPERGP
jgi:glutamate/tyrosine decarboxylase-like PLP-dependent enzyme